MAKKNRNSAGQSMTPEELNRTLTASSPWSWITLAILTMLVVAAVVWSLVWHLPTTVTAKGVVVNPRSTNACFSMVSGTVNQMLVYEGQPLEPGTPVMNVITGSSDIVTIYAGQTGKVSHLLKKAGDAVTQGEAILMFDPSVEGNRTVVCYVSYSESKKISIGDAVRVTLTDKDKTYGYMRAHVVNIDDYAGSSATMAYALSEDNNLIARFQSGAVVAVTCALDPDPDSQNGFAWSRNKGEKLSSVEVYSEVTVKIIVDQTRPIEKLFYKIKAD